MPNWVTNKVQAPSHVIRAMLNADGRVDFRTVAPFPGPHDWEFIDCAAETAAEMVCKIHLISNRKRVNIKKLSDESFKQFLGMLENYHACGYLYSMAFILEMWGTSLNALEPNQADPDNGTCQFDTAWSCPMGVLVKLSERFPDDAITVIYADEDIGSNCGTFTLKAGQVVEEDIAPDWRDLDKAGQAKWSAFAYQVWGLEPETEDEET